MNPAQSCAWSYLRESANITISNSQRTRRNQCLRLGMDFEIIQVKKYQRIDQTNNEQANPIPARPNRKTPSATDSMR